MIYPRPSNREATFPLPASNAPRALRGVFAKCKTDNPEHHQDAGVPSLRDVLTDPVGCEEHAAGVDKADIFVLHKQVIVFDASRPAWCETKFQTSSNRSAPAGLIFYQYQARAAVGMRRQ